MGEFGDALQFVPRFGVENALAGVNDGVFGGQQQLGGGAHILRIAGGAAALDGHIGVVRIRQFAPEYIAGQLQQNGAWASQSQLAECAAQRVGDLFGQFDSA